MEEIRDEIKQNNITDPKTLSSYLGNFNKESDSQELASLREEALRLISQAPALNSTNEDFKYTNFQGALKTFKSPNAVNGLDQIKSISSYDQKCVILNGKYSESLSQIDNNLISITDSSSTLSNEFYANHKRLGEGEHTPLKLISDATFSELIEIKLPEGAAAEIELIVLNIGQAESQDSNAINYVSPRILVTVGKNSQLKLVDQSNTYGDEAFFTNHVISFSLEEGADVEHVKVQNDGVNSLHGSCVFSEQLGKSKFKTVSLNFGSAITRNEVYPAINTENSEAWLIGANVLTSNQIVDNFTVIDHIAPNCESHELYKGMYGGKSKGVFSGTIIVRQEAQKTNAYQSNSSLLCSKDAESNSRPQLKIWADDVKCSHGATVGQLDEEALFYLRARGIPDMDARVMLTRAYVSEVFSHISDDVLRANSEAMLEEKLKSLL